MPTNTNASLQLIAFHDWYLEIVHHFHCFTHTEVDLWDKKPIAFCWTQTSTHIPSSMPTDQVFLVILQKPFPCLNIPTLTSDLWVTKSPGFWWTPRPNPHTKFSTQTPDITLVVLANTTSTVLTIMILTFDPRPNNNDFWWTKTSNHILGLCICILSYPSETIFIVLTIITLTFALQGPKSPSL